MDIRLELYEQIINKIPPLRKNVFLFCIKFFQSIDSEIGQVRGEKDSGEVSPILSLFYSTDSFLRKEDIESSSSLLPNFSVFMRDWIKHYKNY